MTRETGDTAAFETNGVAVGEAEVEIFGAAVCVGAAVAAGAAFLFSACEQLMTSAAVSVTEAIIPETEGRSRVFITGLLDPRGYRAAFAKRFEDTVAVVVTIGEISCRA